MIDDLTAEVVRAMFGYDPATGVFVRRTSSFRWKAGHIAGTPHYKTGHISISIHKRKYKAHRLAWLYVYGEWPSGWLDHRNGDPGDNRIENLRLATPAENARNRRTHRTSKSGLKGVTYRRHIKRWVANILLEGRQVHLGCFDTPEDAHRAYVEAATLHYGEFARC